MSPWTAFLLGALLTILADRYYSPMGDFTFAVYAGALLYSVLGDLSRAGKKDTQV